MNFFGNSATASSGSQTELGSRLYNLKNIAIGNEAIVSILPDDNLVQIPVTTFGKSLLSVQDLNTLVSTLNQGDTALTITDAGVGQIDVKLDNTAVFQWKVLYTKVLNELQTLSIIPSNTTCDIGSVASPFRNAYVGTIQSTKLGLGGATTALSNGLQVNGPIGINSKAELGKAILYFYSSPTIDATPANSAGKTAIIAEGTADWTKSKLHFCLNNVADLTTSTTVTDAKMTILPSGNVGIGTSTPTEKLDVSGSMKIAGLIYPEATGTRDLGSSSLKFNNIYGTNIFSSTLDVSSSLINPTMTLGTTTYTNNPASATTVATLRMHNDKTQNDKFCEIKAVVRQANHSPSIVFSTKVSWGTAITDRMIITENGNIGINQALPTEILDIVGNMKIAGSILPEATGTRDLGSSSLKFNNLYCNTIPDAPLTRGTNSTIPFLQSINASTLSSQCILWQHTTNESTPSNFLLLLESKSVNSSPSYERLQMSAYRGSYKLLHFNPTGKVAIGGDYSATAVTSTLDVGGEMTVRGNIVPEATNTRDIGTTGLTWNGVYCNGLIQPSASNAMTFNCNSAERMRITSAGRVGININNPLAMLDILTNSTTIGMQFVGPSEAYDLTTGSSKNQYLPKGIMVNYANQSGAIPITATLIDIGAYSNTANTNCFFGAVSGTVGNGPANFVFGRRTATATWAETMRIDTAGNLCIGTTSATSGSILTVNGNTTSIGNILPEASGTRDLGSSTKLFNNIYATNLGSSANPITNLYVGSISQSSSTDSLLFNTNSVERMRIDELGRVAIAGPYCMLDSKLDVWGHLTIRGDLVANNGTRNIGNTNTRFLNGYFSSLYVTSGVISTSDRNKKKNIEPIQDAISIISKLKPVSYKFIDGTSNRTHTGFIAQDCENIFCENWAGYIENDNEIGLRYEEFTSINTKAIQELNERLTSVELRKPILFRQDAMSIDNSLFERVSNIEQRLEREYIIEVKEEKSETFELIQSLLDKNSYLEMKVSELSMKLTECEHRINNPPKIESKVEIQESDADGLSMMETLQDRCYRSEQQIAKMDKLIKKLVSATNKLIKGNE